MSRPIKSRKLSNPPRMNGFKPFGIPSKNYGNIILHFDEYESFNLVNYEGLSQDQAAERMNVSRPTFTRIYNCALVKISKAFVECKSIEIVGGSFEFEKRWFKCKRCFKLFDGADSHFPCQNCEFYGRNELIDLNDMK